MSGSVPGEGGREGGAGSSPRAGEKVEPLGVPGNQAPREKGG